jgi:hypothetical protein
MNFFKNRPWTTIQRIMQNLPYTNFSNFLNIELNFAKIIYFILSNEIK